MSAQQLRAASTPRGAAVAVSVPELTDIWAMAPCGTGPRDIRTRSCGFARQSDFLVNLGRACLSAVYIL